MTTMKALRMQAPGGASQLVYEDAPIPEPGAGEALVKIHASAVSPQEILYWSRLWEREDGSPRQFPIPGHDMAGIIAKVGKGVTDLKVGDEVFGLTQFYINGAMAEFAIAKESELIQKPKTLDFVQSAVIPLSALTAWQALFEHIRIQKGQKILITGASGAVGACAVQLAKYFGAIVIATASTDNLSYVKGLGPDEVYDYKKTTLKDVIPEGSLDAVLDCVGGATLQHCWSLLKTGGVLNSVAEPFSKDEAAKYPSVKPIWFILEPNKHHLSQIRDIVDAGNLKVEVAKTMPLEDGSAAFETANNTHLRGKIVLVP